MLSTTTIHAVRALVALGDLPPGRYESAVTLAERIDAPRNYLGKILHAVAESGVVVSRKGPGGGWALGRPADEVVLAEVVEALEGLRAWRGCFLERCACPDADPCPVHARWAPVRDTFLEFLRTTTLRRLAEGAGAWEPPTALTSDENHKEILR